MAVGVDPVGTRAAPALAEAVLAREAAFATDLTDAVAQSPVGVERDPQARAPQQFRAADALLGEGNAGADDVSVTMHHDQARPVQVRLLGANGCSQHNDQNQTQDTDSQTHCSEIPVEALHQQGYHCRGRASSAFMR